MPSSTSNFESPHHRTPEKNWYFVWASTLILTIGVVAVAEKFWRDRGHRPSIVDSPALWAYHRSMIPQNDQTQVTLLGASRIQLGFSMDTFRDRFPDCSLTQLAIDGTHPVGSLQNIAHDKEIVGLIVCSITTSWFREETWDDQLEYVNYFNYRNHSNQHLGLTMNSFLQDRLIVLSPQVKIDRVLRSILARDPLPRPLYLITHSDRSKCADYSLKNVEKERSHRIKRVSDKLANVVVSPEVWMQDVKHVEMWVKMIQQRGGRVVFVRFPTSDEHWEIDEEKFPRELYWDRMAEFTSAETIHFADYPTLSHFHLPDTSHLDCKDKPEFTNALLDILESKGLLTPE